MSLEVHRQEFICIIGPFRLRQIDTLIRIVAGLEGASGGKS